MAKFNHDEIRDTLRVHERTQNISATAKDPYVFAASLGKLF